jgi:ferredoxin-NADP reductase
MSSFNQESVLSVHHLTDTLFSFTTTHNPSFRFRNGEFTMIGFRVGEKPLLRAYSVASRGRPAEPADFVRRETRYALGMGPRNIGSR